MVIEVGLGGRLDATNTIKRPSATLITSIGYDHTHILGSSLQEITREKAGIVKTSVPVFAGKLPEKAREVLTEVAARERAELFFAEEETFTGIDFSKCYLRGGHQQLNARLAALVAKHLGLSNETIEQGLRQVRWPGRLELVSRGEMSFDKKPLGVLLDAAHNIDGINALCRYLKQAIDCEEFSPKQLVLIFSVLERKDWRGILDVFRRLKRELEEDFGINFNFIFTDSGHSSCVAPEELSRTAGQGRVTACPEEALDAALSLTDLENTLIVISGSVYLVGRVRPMVTSEPFASMALS